MPTDLTQILEENLRGLHMPDSVSWWPLAWGWWALLSLIIVIAALCCYRFYNLRKKNKYRKVAVNELNSSLQDWQENQSSQGYLQNANSILKRVSRHLNARSVTQSGQQWVDTLNDFSTNKLSKETLTALSEECYKADPIVDIDKLHQQLQQWLNTHQEAPHA